MATQIDMMTRQMAQMQRDLNAARGHDQTDMNKLQRDLIRLQAQMANLMQQQQQPPMMVEQQPPKKGKKETKEVKKNKSKKGKKKNDDLITFQCVALTRDGERCSKEAVYEDGMCGQHHGMVERGEVLGAKPKKKLNPLCAGTTKKGKPCQRHAMDGENYCYNHIN